MKEEIPLLGTNTGPLPDHRLVPPGLSEEIVGNFRSHSQAGNGFVWPECQHSALPPRGMWRSRESVWEHRGRAGMQRLSGPGTHTRDPRMIPNMYRDTHPQIIKKICEVPHKPRKGNKSFCQATRTIQRGGEI